MNLKTIATGTLIFLSGVMVGKRLFISKKMTTPTNIQNDYTDYEYLMDIIHDLREEITEKDIHLRKLDQQLDGKIYQSIDEIPALRHQIDEYEAQIDDMDEELSDAKRTISNYESENEQLRSKLNTTDTSLEITNFDTPEDDNPFTRISIDMD